MKDQQEIIANQIMDWRRLGFFCLFVSVFLYLGILLPTYASVQGKDIVLSAFSLVFLAFSSFCCWKISRLRGKID